jgi:ketosteroid isomerase-like protein
VRANAATLELINGYYGLMDAGRLDECERYFAADATLKIAHHPTITRWENIALIMKGGMSNPRVKIIAHDVENVWEEDDTVIFEVVAHYVLADGRELDVPGVVIAEIEDGKFRSQRIAADLSPVYGA